MKTHSRRQFVKNVTFLSAGAALSPGFLGLQGCSSDKLGYVLPRRRLGKTGLNITCWALGGAHAERLEPSIQEKSIELCIEKGVRFFDTAFQYGKGKSEEMYGKYLTPKYRDYVNIMSKTLARDAMTARKDLEGALLRMKTEYIDLYMMHSIDSEDDADLRLKQGVLDELLRARDEGKIRHIGFTGHLSYKAHLHLLLKNLPDLEVVMMPINVADPSYNSFIINVIPELMKRDMGILAMKTLSAAGLLGGTRGGNVPNGDPIGTFPSVIPDKLSVRDAHRFALSMPVAAVVSGTNNLEQLEYNLETAREFNPMNAEEREKIIEACADLGSTGEMESYKWPNFSAVRTRFLEK
jgi:uncharacterized protein